MRVLLITNDIIGDTVAGPGIRYREIADRLARSGYTVTVLGKSPRFKEPPLFHYDTLSTKSILKYTGSSEKIIIRGGGPLITLLVCLLGARKDLIADLYTFTHFEVPHLRGANPYERVLFRLRQIFHPHKMKVYAGVFPKFWVANPRQETFLKGLLYAASADLSRKSIYIVPFGYPSRRPQKRKKVLRGVVKGIEEDDFLLIWGGGIWDWLDPLTLIKAMRTIWQENKKVKLYFMGTRAPSGYIPSRAKETMVLSEELGIRDRNVFFNPDWVPYEERTEYLLEADAGITLHPLSLETEFSFRTRNLDYLYCGLPMIHTDGDVWAEIIREKELGIVVPPSDTEAVTAAITRLYQDQSLTRKIKRNLDALFDEFTWDRIMETVVDSLQEEAVPEGFINVMMSLLKEYSVFSLKLPLSPFLR